MAARAWAGLLALAVALSVVGAARAHADYARSEPGAGAVVATPPPQVDIWFTQDMFRRAGANWIRVTGPDGTEVQVGEAAIDDDDRRHLSIALQPGLAPGEYTVAWHTLSAEDGDDDEDTFTFTLDPEAQETSTAMGAEATAPPTETAAAPATATQAEAAATQPQPTHTPAASGATPTPASGSGGGCAGALLPAAGLVFLAWKRRRQRP
jgi:methionine-rich copper-binding protein CopC